MFSIYFKWLPILSAISDSPSCAKKVPVQRVTKYPLLLARLFKVTPLHHADRGAIKKAQEKIENALEQMNKDAKDVNSLKLWKRITNSTMSGSASHSPTKRSDSSGSLASDEVLSSINLRKMALESLGWPETDAHFPLEGRILFTQPSEGNSISNWHKKAWTVKLTPVQAILAVQSTEELPEITVRKELIFPSDIAPIKDASLVVIKKEKGAKFTLVRDPLPLDRCVICREEEWDDCFEIQEFINKEQYVFKGEESGDTQLWFRTLQFYTQSLGGWRKRRKGLANIMIDPNVAASVDNTYYLEAEEEGRRRSRQHSDGNVSPAPEGATALPPTEG